jgi:tRNA threonylcarbamoyl adenosine modification protein YeaZ
MIRFLAMHSTYHTVEYALYHGQKVVECVTLDKVHASSRLVPSLQQLLIHHACPLSDLTYITVNRGPAPFTTLRTLITTINGIRFARHVPLIGIDGFAIWFCMLPDTTYDTAIIMNAFNQEIYIALRQAGSSAYQSWYGPVPQVIQQLQATITTKLVLAGNALPLYHGIFEQTMRDRVLFNEINFMTDSLHYSALLSLQAWHDDKQSSMPLTPLYLKTTAY